jgi:hypothetical protein
VTNSASNSLSHAIGYIKRGWAPVPIAHKEKGPRLAKWQELRLTEATANQHFNGAAGNVGVILGGASQGLTDIDLDCDEAAKLAPHVLPKTPCRFGRASRRASHWLYQTDLAQTAGKAAIQFKDPTNKKMLVELRLGGASGAQTVFPGSTHNTGELIEWDENGKLEKVEGVELRRRVALLAACCLLTRYWPKEKGDRHGTALVVGGFMARAGLSGVGASKCVEAIARTAGDPEVSDRRSAARDAAKAYVADKHTYGLTQLRVTFGDEIANCVAEWLGYREAADNAEADQYVKPDASVDDSAAATHYTLTATPFVWRDPTTIPHRRFLYGAHYIRQFVSSTIAPGGVGKSSLVLIEALAMATGRPLLDVQPEKRLRVWYWNGEDPKVETERRVAAACIHYGIAHADLDGWLFVDSGRDAKIVIAEANKDGAKIMRPVVDAVIATIRTNEIDVMIVDPFVSCHHVPENDNGGMDGVVKEWGGIADAANTAIELVHHSRKTNGAEVTVEDARGASAVVFATRDARAINTMTKQEAENAGVVNKRLHFRCESGKANLAPPADKADWFQLMSIPLGNGDSAAIDNGDKEAVVAPWQYPNMLAGVTSDLTAAALAKIRAGKYRSDSQATEWVGKVVAEVMGFDLGKTHEKAKTRNLIKLWLDNGALAKVKRKDKNGDERSFVEVARDE